MPETQFTPTEAEIAARICMPGTVPQIAKERGIAPITVTSHIRSIYKKSGVHNRKEFIAMVWGAQGPISIAQEHMKICYARMAQARLGNLGGDVVPAKNFDDLLTAVEHAIKAVALVTRAYNAVIGKRTA